MFPKIGTFHSLFRSTDFPLGTGKPKQTVTPHKYSIKRLRCSIVPIIIYINEKDREIAIYTVYIPIYKYIAIFWSIGTAAAQGEIHG